MAKVNVISTDTNLGMAAKVNTLSMNVGDLANLTAGIAIDSDVVGAINHVYSLVNQDSDFRSKFSLAFTGGDGAGSYDSNTGIFSITGPSAAEVRAHVSVTDAGGDGSLAYNSTSGAITYTGPSASEVRAHVSVTDASGDGSLAYNSTSGVITYTGPSASEVRAHINATDAGGDGSLAYNASTGAITYTGPSASEVRAHFSAGEGIDISSGVIAGEDATASNKGIASFSATNFAISSGAVTVKADGISSTELKDLSTILIKNAAGTTLKTLHGAGS
tara:strand:+ start:340 stop:1167 length:828 start_codon:yes stop_codon:yes gene_type:complete